MANQEHLDILKQGVETWNQWRQEHPEIERNRGTNLGVADLSFADLHDANLKDADLSFVDLRDANLKGANLSDANLVCANLKGANLNNADLLRVSLWRANLRGADLSEADLNYANLREATLIEANLSYAGLSEVTLIEADLRGADLSHTYLCQSKIFRADFREANLKGALLSSADLSGSDFSRADLSGATLNDVNLRRATLREASLHKANLHSATLSETDLSRADLSGANLSDAILVKANLTGATLSQCSIHGISVWNVQLEGAKQDNLVITDFDEPTITVDNLKVAQFIYLLLNNAEIREVIDTITSKVVLILGRFMPERKAVLDALREELRKHNYSPVLFDFEKPASRDLTETVSTLAHLARFIIVDLTDPSSAPHEVATVIPQTIVPVQPLLLRELLVVDGKEVERRAYSMFKDLQRRYHWVLPTYTYTDQAHLLATLQEQVIAPAEQKAQELAKR